MRRLCIALIILSLGLLTQSVSAHVLTTDGNIGAVMHISPDDSPVAGVPAHFFFSFKDTANEFYASGCSCDFVVKAHGQQILDQHITASTEFSAQELGATFTFPKRDVYQVTMQGKPLVAGTFQPFSLTYDVRVDKGSGQITERVPSPYLVLGTVVLGLSYPSWIISVVRKRRKT